MPVSDAAACLPVQGPSTHQVKAALNALRARDQVSPCVATMLSEPSRGLTRK
jgi:hypothetical protein